MRVNPLTRSQRLLVLVIVCAPVVAMVVMGAAHVVHQARLLLTDARWIVGDVLSQQLDRQVHVGHARLAPLGTAVIEKLEIAEGKTFAGGKMISVARLTVHYDLGAIAVRGKGAGGVKSVEVVRPTVHIVRKPSGALNIMELVRPRVGPPGPPFTGSVRMVDGRISFADRFRSRPGPPPVLDLHNVNGSFDAGHHPSMSFAFSAAGEAGRLKSMRVVGSFDAASRLLRVDAMVVGASAPFFARLAEGSRNIDVRAGTVDASVGVTTRLPVKGVPSLTGLVRMANVKVAAPGLTTPVESVSGTVLLSGDSAAVDVSGTLAGTRATISGTVTDFKKPQVALAVSSQSIDIEGLVRGLGMAPARGVRVAGAGGLTATVGGTAAGPEAQGKLRVGGVSAYGYSVRDVRLSAAYRAGTLFLGSLSFLLNGARAQACGVVETGGARSISIRGSVRGLSVDSLRLPPRMRAKGLVDADFTLHGTANRPQASASVKATGVSAEGVAVPALSADVDVDLRSLQGSGRVALNTAGGLIQLRGVGRPDRIDLAYSAEAVDAAVLGQFLKQKEIGGTVYAGGRIFGKPTDPTVTGTLQVFKGRYEDYEADYTQVAFSGNKHKLVARDGIVRQFPAELRFAGTAAGLQSDRIAFGGEAHVKRLQMERVFELAGRELNVAGTIAGDFTFSAAYLPKQKHEPGKLPLANAVADGTLRLDDGLAYGYLISTAGAKLAFRDNVLTLSDAKITSGDAQVGLSGTVDVDAKQVDLAFDMTGFNLARVRNLLESYLTVGGVASASGTLKGPFNEVMIAASAKIGSLTVDEIQFDQATIDAAYSNNVLSSFGAKLTRGDQSFEFDGTDFDLKTGCAASISGNVSKVLIPDVWTMVLTSPYLASEKAKSVRDALQSFPRLSGGVIGGSFQVAGCLVPPEEPDEKVGPLDRLEGSVKLEASDVAFDSRHIDSMTLDASAASGAVTLNEAKAVSGDTYAALIPLTPGTPVYEKGGVALELVASNLDLSRLQPWLGDYTPTGVATADFTFEGDPKQPDVRGSIEVVDPGFHLAKFSNLRVSQIRVGKERVDVTDVILSVDGHQAVAQGYLPWDWNALTVPKDKPFEFTAGLKNEDLSLLNTLTGFVQPKPLTSGALVAEVKAAGTLADYTLSGLVKVQDGTLAMKGFSSSFVNVDVDIGFDGKDVVFNQFSAQSTSGGTVGLQPGGRITVAGKKEGYGSIDLLLNAAGLVLEEKDAFGFQEKVKTQVDAGIAIGGTVYMPVMTDAPVAGYEPGVTISNATLEFAIPEKKAAAPPIQLPIHPFFKDLHVDLGNNVRVRPPQMDILVSGAGLVSGEFGKSFSVGLDLTVKEGSIDLFASRLRIVPGAKMTLRFQPPREPEFVLTGFEATTSVMATGPLGRRERYKVTIAASGNVMNLSEKNVTFKSDPNDLSKEEILAALGHVQGLLNTTQTDFQKELGNALTGVATSALLMPVERLFTERLGFEEFSIESGAFAPLSLYLSRRLFGDFYLSFYQRLQATANVQDTSWQFLFGYRFKQFYSVNIGIDDQQTTSGELSFTRAVSL